MPIGFLPNIGPLELGILLVIVIIILGPKRIPQAARAVGQGFRNFKGSIDRPEDDDPDELTKAEASDPATSKPSEKSKTES
ncbi:MAG: twin-arginine translocase TatA/TatE family subunit [Thermoleophilia bacterium]|nr:twin-arginine translocase TatA/TatE family subunit [Thermoleophilia bacterium]